MNFFIKNKNEKTIAVVDLHDATDRYLVESAEISSVLNNYEQLSTSIAVLGMDGSELKQVGEDDYVVFKDGENIREYIIKTLEETDEDGHHLNINAELSAVELIEDVVQSKTTGLTNDPAVLLTAILTGTRWTVGTVDATITKEAFTEELKWLNALEAIDKLTGFYECEVTYSYEADEQNITKRMVNLHKKSGKDEGRTFEMDEDLTSIRVTRDASEVATAIILEGNEDENGQPVTIADMVWREADGNPADKPKGKKYLVNKAALEKYGRTLPNGQKKNRFIYRQYDVNAAESLINIGWTELLKYAEAKATYEAEALDLYALTDDDYYQSARVAVGDTVRIKDKAMLNEVLVETRVVEMVRDLLDGTRNSFVFGDEKDYIQTRENTYLAEEAYRKAEQAIKENEKSQKEITELKEKVEQGGGGPETPEEPVEEGNPNLLLSMFNAGAESSNSAVIFLENDREMSVALENESDDGCYLRFPPFVGGVSAGGTYTLSFDVTDNIIYKERYSWTRAGVREIRIINAAGSKVQSLVPSKEWAQMIGSNVYTFVAESDLTGCRIEIEVSEYSGKVVLANLKLEAGAERTEYALHVDDILRSLEDEQAISAPNIQATYLHPESRSDMTVFENIDNNAHISKYSESELLVNLTTGIGRVGYIYYPPINYLVKDKWYTFSFSFSELVSRELNTGTDDFLADFHLRDSDNKMISGTDKKIRYIEGEGLRLEYRWQNTAGLKSVRVAVGFRNREENEGVQFIMRELQVTAGIVNRPFTKSEDKGLVNYGEGQENMQPFPTTRNTSTGSDDDIKLLDGSKDTSFILHHTADKYSFNQDIYMPRIEGENAGDFLTVSFDLTLLALGNTSNKNQLYMEVLTGSTRTSFGVVRLLATMEKPSQKVLFSFPVKATNSNTRIRFRLSSKQKWEIDKLKVQRGLISSEWTPASSDVATKEELNEHVAVFQNQIGTISSEVFNSDGTSRINTIQERLNSATQKSEIISVINNGSDKINGDRVDASTLTGIPVGAVAGLNLNTARPIHLIVGESVFNGGFSQVRFSDEDLELADTTQPYQVTVQAYGNIFLYVSTRDPEFFAVASSDKDTSVPFGYQVYAVPREIEEETPE